MATLIVVRRDAPRTFEHVLTMLGPGVSRDVEVIWDRRSADRRRPDGSPLVERRVRDRRSVDDEASGLTEARHRERRERLEVRIPERRQAERRRRPPDTWTTLGFLLVQQIVLPDPDAT